MSEDRSNNDSLILKHGFKKNNFMVGRCYSRARVARNRGVLSDYLFHNGNAERQ